MIRSNRSRARALRWAALVGLLAGAVPGVAEAQLSGAIFTTTQSGTTVNGNIYGSRDAVYLNGGPQNRSASGLPDGTYYYQVTNPSGSVLLSTDPAACRQLRVSGGRVQGPAPSGQDPDCSHPAGAANAANGSTGVRLAPFDLTPNAGGEYKVWLVRQGSTTTVDAEDPRVLHFSASNVKTDNFKVRESAPPPDDEPPPRVSAILGQVYYDLNTNARIDASEVSLAGVRVQVQASLPGATAPEGILTTSDASGVWSLVFPVGTTYTACVVVPGPVGEQTWRQTGPLPGMGAGSGSATANFQRCWAGGVGVIDQTGLDFGLVALGAGNGHTRGFWSNRNGQRVLSRNDAAWRTLLNTQNLRRADGSSYAVPEGAFSGAYADFRTWLLDATATNMALMLSSQLTAMRLNVAYNGASANARVYGGPAPAQCDVPVDASGFIALGTLLDRATASLAVNGDTTAAGPVRTCQEYMKTTIDEGNNNRNFVLPQPIDVVYP